MAATGGGDGVHLSGVPGKGTCSTPASPPRGPSTGGSCRSSGIGGGCIHLASAPTAPLELGVSGGPLAHGWGGGGGGWGGGGGGGGGSSSLRLELEPSVLAEVCERRYERRASSLDSARCSRPRKPPAEPPAPGGGTEPPEPDPEPRPGTTSGAAAGGAAAVAAPPRRKLSTRMSPTGTLPYSCR